jgi:cyclopropane-fatty-acyl-phospholipid synthase
MIEQADTVSAGLAAPDLLLTAERLRARRPPFTFELRDPWHRAVRVGAGDPEVVVTARTPAGLTALRRLRELAVIEAYLAGDIDIAGDLVRAMELRPMLRSDALTLRLWSVLKPAFRGRISTNPRTVATHYDSGNIQLLAIDDEFALYTPGVYVSDDESLELAARRKLENVYDGLGLAPGASVLDIGCGWGGWLRFCAERGVDVTGISLSRHQLQHARRELESRRVPGTVLYADFFSFAPDRRFDAISMMGVLEELSDYRLVLRRISEWLRPGGYVYLDFAAVAHRFQVSTFIAKYVWPGAFRMVHFPQVISAIDGSPLELVSVDEDRRNYYVWTRKVHDRWVERRDEAVAATDERTYRLMSLLGASTCFIMGPRSARATAYRVLLRRRHAGARLGELLATADAPARQGPVGRLPPIIQRALR